MNCGTIRGQFEAYNHIWMIITLDDNQLQKIQALQIQDRAGAESLLLAFVRETFPTLDVQKVELRPLAVSLNSFNGFLTLSGGGRLFFKTHVEPGSVVSEYYNSQLLAEAGYPIIAPQYASTEYGKQFLIYEVIDSPSVFDVAHAIELGAPLPHADLLTLTTAQNHADAALVDRYLGSLAWQTADQAAEGPVHQLFYHRLGERYQQFYTEKAFQLPGSFNLAWEALCRSQITLNGVAYRETLGEAIIRARRLLDPRQAGWSIVGHGDAHNGNVFLTPTGLVYFDPAFGGRHHPLLDLTKPLFHNIFATWMYHPGEVGARLHIAFSYREGRLAIEHDYSLSETRQMFLDSKFTYFFAPFMAAMRDRSDWDADLGDLGLKLRAALMCCPLLTMNLADRGRFSPEVALLGLSYVIEMGLLPETPNRPIDRFLSEFENR
jgi:hypothetical protein